MRARFTKAPTYVCEGREYHHSIYLAVFTGLELEGEVTKDGTMYQATLKDVLQALMQLGDRALMAITYWSGHWLRIGLRLDEHVYFPIGCMAVIEDTAPDQPLAA